MGGAGSKCEAVAGVATRGDGSGLSGTGKTGQEQCCENLRQD